jgi:aminodeoxyfutalosine deaminase
MQETLPYPKIELHVHLEGTVGPRTLLDISRKRDLPLPVDTEEELSKLYSYRDFAHFIQIWVMTTNVLREQEDFHRITVEYAQEAASHGALYIEGIFSPAERAQRGADWQAMFEGVCDGAQEARERFGVEMRITPDIPRDLSHDELEMGRETARWAARYRDSGVVGIGLGGLEDGFPPEPFKQAFDIAREGGLGSVPHAGEAAGTESIRGAIDVLGADRLRHGIVAATDPQLCTELAERGITLDVCPISNVRTGRVPSLEDHPLPKLLDAGINCSVSTDDPAMFDTDLSRDYEAAESLGADPRRLFDNGLAGALCDDATKQRLRANADAFDWSTVGVG